MTYQEAVTLKRQLVREMRETGTIGELPTGEMLIGWTAIMGLTALMFWATLQPARRRAL